MDVAQVLVDAGCNVNTVKYETLEAPIHSAIKLCMHTMSVTDYVGLNGTYNGYNYNG